LHWSPQSSALAIGSNIAHFNGERGQCVATFLSELSDQTSDALRRVSAYVDDATTPTLRLGVTGLARAGKTVFITALVRTLTEGGAKPALRTTQLSGFRAFLEPQPDDDVPRFGYETHLSALSGDPAQWPHSTRQISQLRVTLEWEPRDWVRRNAGVKRRLHIDIIDYPGEWLADIGLLDQDFASWSAHVLALAREASPGPARDAWLAFVDTKEAKLATPDTSGATAAEQAALNGASLFSDYLQELKSAGRLPPSAGPGRFLMPGDYEGSPLLTFFPTTAQDGSLAELLRRRFESYKSTIVRPFFAKHFSRIERQVVLVDVLGALNLGPAAVIEMENALEGALAAFRPGRDSWLGRLRGQRIDSVLFAATKADHLHRSNHKRLRAILAKVVDRASGRTTNAGARSSFVALAALRTTEDVERSSLKGAPALECVRGIPIEGEKLGGELLDSDRMLTVFPGDLPKEPLDAFDPEIVAPGSLSFVRFRPRIERGETSDLTATNWPHVGLDLALAFLIGDRVK